MSISKEWKWEVLSKDDEYWNSIDFMVPYLNYRWKKNGFKVFLDIGCGLGRHSIYMAENGYDVYALDNSKYVVDVVKEKAYSKELKVICNIGDVSDLPYDDESVDCMIAIGIMANNDKNGVASILKEMHRVLKDGGETYFNIVSKVTDYEFSEELLNGNIFYNINESDFEWLFKDFTIIDIKHVENSIDNSSMPSYCVLLKKVNSSKSFKQDKLKESAFLL